jgi:hypothetical protein
MQALAAILAAAGAAAVQAETIQTPTDPASRVKIEVDGWAGLSSNFDGRDAGLMPVTATITNDSPRSHSWTIQPDLSFGRTRTAAPSARIAVAAGGTGKATLYVDPNDARNGAGVWLEVTGPGVAGGKQRFQVNGFRAYGPAGATPPALPCGISRRALDAKRDALAKFQITGQSLDMDGAPDDWRGWSTFGSILLTESDLLAMPAGSRKALLEWAALGGRAGVLVEGPSAERLDTLGFPAANSDGRRTVGAGELIALEWNGKTMPEEAIARFLDGRSLTDKADRLLAYTDGSGVAAHLLPVVGQWTGGFRKLYDVFGPRTLPVLPILAFLATFGILAGPLNVMLFAGPGRRSWMFWTTPAISLGATAFLLGLMFLRDGVGGAGSRRVLALLMPGQNGMAIVQEQFSRTGVLLDSSFPIREPSWMRPVGEVEVDSGFNEVDGTIRRGDWFRSRSDQAYVIEAVRPSRAKLEFVAAAAGPPAVISSIDVPLDRVWLIDEKGNFWTATDVGTGQRKPLEPGDANGYARWFDAIAADAGPVRLAALEAVRNRRGHAYAETAAAAKVAVETLGSIRWQDDKAAFMGPFTRTAPE